MCYPPMRYEQCDTDELTELHRCSFVSAIHHGDDSILYRYSHLPVFLHPISTPEHLSAPYPSSSLPPPLDPLRCTPLHISPLRPSPPVPLHPALPTPPHCAPLRRLHCAPLRRIHCVPLRSPPRRPLTPLSRPHSQLESLAHHPSRELFAHALTLPRALPVDVRDWMGALSLVVEC
jgi:hypothetical protein